MKEGGEMRLKSTIYESTLSTAARSPFPNGEGNDTRIPLFSTQSLPRVGKVASGASRIGFWRYERQVGKCISSTPFARAPYPLLTRSPFPNGEGYDTRMPLFSHCQSEYRKRGENNTDGQSLPRVGKVASKASRI